jgi:putative Mg2+ transporter-C (MgtC) family protein
MTLLPPDALIAWGVLGRIMFAVIFGAVIGIERQWRFKATGTRTNALVSAGAALFVVLGTDGFAGGVTDPTRVAAQVVSGIGFLGAGVILRDGLSVRGLATAATLWCSAAVGSLAGAGLIWMAAIGAVAVVACNTVLPPISQFIMRRTHNGHPAELE